jgi:hypothetical protein
MPERSFLLDRDVQEWALTVVRVLRRPSLAYFLLGFVVVCGCVRESNPDGITAPASIVAYPDTNEGFREFVDELLYAYESRDEKSVHDQMRSLIIPHTESWFMRLFGPSVGPTFDLQYRHQLSWQYGRLDTYFRLYTKAGDCLVHLDHSEQGHISPFVSMPELFRAAEQPVKIYSAAIANREEGPWWEIGSFVYVDGNFRFLGHLEISPSWPSFWRNYGKPFED